MKAVLGVLPPPGRHLFGASHLAGHVVNVNVPKGGLADIRGLYLAHQGQHCHFPDFQARAGRTRGSVDRRHRRRACLATPLFSSVCGVGCGGAGLLPVSGRAPASLSRPGRQRPCLPAWLMRAVQELEADAHVREGHAGAVTLRAFRNAAGSLRGDLSQGCDSWAVGQGWAAVTPICLRSGACCRGGTADAGLGWRRAGVLVEVQCTLRGAPL